MNVTQRPKVARTFCKSCVFTIMDGVTQTGCQLNNLDKLANNGATIIEGRDNESEFYVIENRYCNSFRPEAWRDSLTLDACDSLEVIMRQENAFNPDVVIYCDKDSTEKDIKQSFKANTDMAFTHLVGECPCSDTIQFYPCSKHIILDGTEVDGIVLRNKLTVLGDNLSVHRVLNNHGNKAAIMDGLWPKFTSNYITIVNCKDRLKDNYYERLDNLLNNEMKRIVLDIDDGVITISRLALRMFNPFKEDGKAGLDSLLEQYPNGLIL